MMKKTLFPHQNRAIDMMEQREADKKIVHSTYRIDLNMSIYSDITGYGKTATILGLILRDRMVWDVNEEHVQSFISGMYGNGCILKRSLVSMKRIDTNLIVAGTTIIRQWIRELDETSLQYAVIINKKKLEQLDPNEYDVILCSPSFYNYLLERFPSYAWKRFIYDEPTHTNITSMRQVIAGFIWLITATPELLLQQHRYSHHFLSSIFTQYMDYTLFKNLIIKNDDDFVRQSFALPPLYQVHHTCHQPLYHAVKDLISETIMDMIAAGNIESAVRYMGGNSTSNLFELIEKDKKDAIEQATWKIARFQRMGDENKVKKWTDRVERLDRDLEELKDRLDKLVNVAPCPICLEKKKEPILLTCCQNMFCGQCVFQWFHTNASCPMCRKKIMTEQLIYITSDSQSTEGQAVIQPSHPSKTDVILSLLLQNKYAKTIIFSSYQETFDTIREMLRENEIRFGEIKGGISSRERIIHEFKHEDLPVLFLQSMECGAGLDLKETTDIILYHPMSESLFTQIRGRAYRIGRTMPLTIHYLN